jgi:hypothetical protein
MGGRRIVYFIGLVMGAVFHTLYGQYLSYMLLRFLILLPFVSLLVSLPAMLRVRVLLSASGASPRGEKAAARLRIDSRFFLPVGCLSMTFTGENKFTGESMKKRKCSYWGVLKAEEDLPLPGERCGVISCSLGRVWVWDYMGIFVLPVKRCDPAVYTVLPVADKPVPLPELDQDSAITLKPKPGGGYSEEHELRPYRQGDPLNMIHWKLSSKLDDPIVREPQLMQRKRITLSVSPCADPGGLESQLDQLMYLSLDLVEKGIPHRVCFGAHMEAYIKDRNSLDEFMETLLSHRPDGSRGPVDRNKSDELVYSIRPKGGEGAKKP